MDLRAALGGKGVLRELLFRRSAERVETPPADRWIEDGVVDEALGDGLLRWVRERLHELQDFGVIPHVDGPHVGAVKGTHRTDLLRKGCELRLHYALVWDGVGLGPKGPFDRLRLMHSGFAETLHAEEHGFQAGGL